MTTARLHGRTILVTRAAADAESWANHLAALGARPLVLPCLVCEPITDTGTARALGAALASAHWLVLQSRRGAEACAALTGGACPDGVRIAAVGPATARAALGAFGRVDFVAPEANAASLGVALAERISGGVAPVSVVVAGAAGGRPDAVRALEASGISVAHIEVYRIIPAPPDDRKQDLAAAGVDDILLASPSAVTGLLNRALPSRAQRVITIGPTTTAAAQAAGLAVAAEAGRPDLAGMLEVM